MPARKSRSSTWEPAFLPRCPGTFSWRGILGELPPGKGDPHIMLKIIWDTPRPRGDWTLIPLPPNATLGLGGSAHLPVSRLAGGGGGEKKKNQGSDPRHREISIRPGAIANFWPLLGTCKAHRPLLIDPPGYWRPLTYMLLSQQRISAVGYIVLCNTSC